jgi:hypothetical protein
MTKRTQADVRERFGFAVKTRREELQFTQEEFAERAGIHRTYVAWPLDYIEDPGTLLSYKVVDKMRLSKDKTQLTVNPPLTLSGIPPEVSNTACATGAPWIGSSTSTASPRTNAAASAPTPTARTTRSTSCG